MYKKTNKELIDNIGNLNLNITKLNSNKHQATI